MVRSFSPAAALAVALGLLGLVLLSVPGRRAPQARSLERAADGTEAGPPAPRLRGAGPRSAEGEPPATGAGDAPPASEEIEEIEEIECLDEDALPPDPLERGACKLALTFVEQATGEPYATEFELWRLGAPGNADWTEGDQKQASGHETAPTATLSELPEGRYRLHVHGARKGGEDPPAFAVAGAETVVEVPVDAPPAVPVHVQVFDERGSLLTRGTWEAVGSSSSSCSPDVPDWVVRRQLKGERTAGGGCMWFGCGDGCGSLVSHDIEAGVSGFAVGTYRGARRYESLSFTRRFRFRDRASVSVYVDEDALPARPLVALAPSLATLEDQLRLPDGRRLYRTNLTLEATCRAVAIEEGDDPVAAALALPIAVRALDGRHCVASGTVRLDEGECTLVAREP